MTPRPLNSLLINVAALLQEPIGAVRRYTLADAHFIYEGVRRPIHGDLRLLRTDQSLLATARLRTQADDVCGACLSPVALALDIEFDEEFWPPHDALAGRSRAPQPEPDGFDVIDSQIDLSEAVRQYAEMARPMSPRCGPNCPGAAALGPLRTPEIDERWAALAPLREQLNRP